MPLNQESGESVYISENLEDHERRSFSPLYEAARELIRAENPNTLVIDIGCSDMVATGPLIKENINVVGLDLDESAVARAKQFYPDAKVFVSDISAIPLSVPEEQSKVVVMLDILEHLEWENAANVLEWCKTNLGNHKIIVSMPNISNFSVFTWRERIKMYKQGQRPPTGLYDRTHKILTDIEGHINLFTSAGYSVDRIESTSWDEGVSGKWQWKDSIAMPADNPNIRNSKKYRVVSYFSKVLGPKVLEKVYSRDTEVAYHTAAGYQGLYVISPSSESKE